MSLELTTGSKNKKLIRHIYNKWVLLLLVLFYSLAAHMYITWSLNPVPGT